MSDDPLAVLVRFAGRLRAAGIAAGPDRTFAAAEALAVMGVAGEADPYWPLRIAFCARDSDLPAFDAVYRAWTGGAAAPEVVDDVAVPAGPGEAPTGEGEDGEPGGGEGAAGDAELATRDLERLSEAEAARIRAWIARLALAPPGRRAMRRRPARAGRVDIGRTMRTVMRQHGEVSALRYRRRVHRARRRLLLIDVSGSMEPYSDMLLHFALAAVAARPRTTEVFAVGTRWTRLTAHLRAGEFGAALRALESVELDWHGGTLLGEVLRDFLRVWGGRGAVRSAVVVLASDGFEFRSQAHLRRQVARLSRLCGELIWVDPNRRRDDYRPLDPDLAAAQSHATLLLAGHNYEALEQLARVMCR